MAFLDLGQPDALVVQDVEGDGASDVDHDLGRASLAALLLDGAQDVQRRAFGAADGAGAQAMRAGDEAGLGEGGTQALAAHLQQAEVADGAELDAGAVVLEGVLELLLDGGVVAPALHVNEVNDDQPGQVTQPKLPCGLLCGFQVGAQRRLLDAALPRAAAGVHVYGDQRLGLVDDQVAAAAELHGGQHHGVQLLLDLRFGEQRLRVLPQLDLLGVGGHQHAHEVAGGAPPGLPVHKDVVHVAGVHVADGALDKAGLLVDQGGRHALHGQVADLVPLVQQVLAVAQDFRLGALGACGADDQAHAAGQVQLGRHLLQAAAVGGGGDLAADAAAPGGVGHQDGEAAGEGDIGGEGRALGAALLLHDLDQQDLAAADHFLDLVVAEEAGGGALLPRLVGVGAVQLLGRRFGRAGVVRLVLQGQARVGGAGLGDDLRGADL